MDNTTNIYGVREITLTADSQVIFHSNLDKFAFDETRYLNTFTDYEEWKDHRSFYMRSFIEPGNRLRFLESVNRGILRIDEPRTYHLTYTLADAFGNATRLSIWIEGKKQEIPRSIRLIQNYSIGVARIGSALKASVSSCLKVIYIMTSTSAIR